MDFLTATQSTWFLIGPIANVMGILMNWIYIGLSFIGIPNIGIAIILFTVIIKGLMLPSSIKQQKSSKLQAVMAPELQAIQARYKGKTDNESLLKQQAETKEVYAKYGTSAAGGCLQLLIQLPIMFALYQVILHLPGYITHLKDMFLQVVTPLQNISGYATNTEFIELAKSTKAITDEALLQNTDNLVDVLYAFKPENWEKFTSIFNNPALTAAYEKVAGDIYSTTHFLGIDLTMTPTEQWTTAWWVVLIPLLAGGLQWLSSRLMQNDNPQQNNDANPMGNSMKTMNVIFPIMTVVFCFTFSSCIGVYWVASSAVQLVIQLIVNSYMNKVDLNEMVRQNVEKANLKRIKKGQAPIKFTPINVAAKSLEEEKQKQEEKKKALKDEQNASSDYYANHSTAKKGSLAEKAGMVQQYEERMRDKKAGKKE